jgi:hypothetical protein
VPAFYNTFGDHLPKALWAELDALVNRLGPAEAVETKTAAPIKAELVAAK